MIWSAKTWAQEPPKPDSYTQLPREQREVIAVCFEENAECHRSLKRSDAAVQDEWQVLIVAGLMGFVGGLVVAHQGWITK